MGLKGDDEKEGTQIDLLISRKDNVVNMCEMKFYGDEFCKKFSSRIANDRYLIYTKDYFKDGTIVIDESWCKDTYYFPYPRGLLPHRVVLLMNTRRFLPEIVLISERFRNFAADF